MKWFTWAVLSAFFAGLTALLAKVRVAYVNSKSAIAVRTMWVISFPAMLIPVFSATLLAHNFTRNRRAPMLYFEFALFVGLPTFGRERISAASPPCACRSEQLSL
jgi:uncharacterized membrane protein